MIGPVKPPLWDEQMDLELEMADNGKVAFYSAIEKARARGDGASVGGASLLVRHLLDPTAQAIADFRAKATEKKAGRKHMALRVLNLDDDTLAFLTCKLLISLLCAHASNGGRLHQLQTVAVTLGATLEVEARIAQWVTDNPKLAITVISGLNKTTSHAGHKRRAIVHAMTSSGAEWTNWTRVERLHVGQKFVDLFSGATAALDFRYSASRPIHVSLNETATQFIEDADVVRCLLWPRLKPCIIPPKPWTDKPGSGGYWTDLGLQNPQSLIKGRGKAGYDAVDAVNMVQSTAWVVNRRVLEVLEWAANTDDGRGIVATLVEQPVPAKPVDIDTNEEARRAWRKLAAVTHAANASTKGRRLQTASTLSMAKEFAKYPAIYFPHQLDFRGRMYAMPPFLTPQGPDYAKALLMFANGDAIEDDVAVGWLAIHGANTYGVDKVSLGDRIDWAFANEADILATAADPRGTTWWLAADKPLSFLAWCFEWAGYLEQGLGFVSHLPVAMDGSCNGLQHYSAMLRDPVGGAAVNLVPHDKPADIYQVVANRVLSKLQDTVSTGTSDDAVMAAGWLEAGVVDRKLTKRPVMVLPYGGTYMSCSEYVRDAVNEAFFKDGVICPFDTEDLFPATRFLSSVVWDSIGDTVVAARAAMTWLQAVIGIAGKAGLKEIRWTTPSGFLVKQRYLVQHVVRVDTALNGSVIKLGVRQPTGDKVDKRRQSTAVAPNFVHSLDASALVLTTLMAQANGVTSFAMIHDSYGTTAAQTSKLAACIRHAFVQMYTEFDVLEDFRNELIQQLPAEWHDSVPLAPVKGTLDLQGVLASDFFFA